MPWFDRAFHKALRAWLGVSQSFTKLRCPQLLRSLRIPSIVLVATARCPRRICKRTSPCEDTRCLYLVYPTTVFWRLDHWDLTTPFVLNEPNSSSLQVIGICHMHTSLWVCSPSELKLSSIKEHYHHRSSSVCLHESATQSVLRS